MESFVEMMQRQQEEVNNFPMFFAFSDQQFVEGMRKLGLNPEDTDKIYALSGTGGYYRRSDGQKLLDMLDRHDKERQEAINNDTTGKGFVYDMFSYELGNQEFTYTGDDSDTIEALGYTKEEINNSPKLKKALEKAKKDAWKRYDARN